MTIPHHEFAPVFYTDEGRLEYERTIAERARIEAEHGLKINPDGDIVKLPPIAVIPIAVTRSQEAEVVSLLLEDIERQYGPELLDERHALLKASRT